MPKVAVAECVRSVTLHLLADHGRLYVNLALFSNPSDRVASALREKLVFLGSRGNLENAEPCTHCLWPTHTGFTFKHWPIQSLTSVSTRA